MRWLTFGVVFGATVMQALGVSYRWAESSKTIYAEGLGDTTLTQIKAALPSAPLTEVQSKVWFLGANLQLTDGARLNLHGTNIGDVHVLRLKSNNSSKSGSTIAITADWGAIDIRNVMITSWDESKKAPDTEYEKYMRSYIRVRSRLASDGVTALESRMDISNSDIGYLGYFGAEAYGLAWKVSGSQSNIFELVNVYGDVTNSRIHHCYYGIYSWGAYGMRIIDNETYSNVLYGIDPHDDSDYLLIEGNHAHHNGKHGIIASKRCDHTVMRFNNSHHNGEHGLMLHRECDFSLVESNLSWANGSEGIAIFDSNDVVVRGNTCLSNGSSGIRLSVGSAGGLYQGNECGYAKKYGLYIFKGSDAPRPGGDGRCRQNWFVDNYIHHNTAEGLRFGDADDNLLSNNVFIANSSKILFEKARGNVMDGNSLPANVVVESKGSSSLRPFTVFRNMASTSIKLDSYSTARFEDSHGQIFDPTESGLPTVAGQLGSALELSSKAIGGSSVVLRRNLAAVPSNGTVSVEPITWQTSGSYNKEWISKTTHGDAEVSYVVADLVPGTTYTVRKNGSSIGTVTANAFGGISVEDVPGTTGSVRYSVQP